MANVKIHSILALQKLKQAGTKYMTIAKHHLAAMAKCTTQYQELNLPHGIGFFHDAFFGILQPRCQQQHLALGERK